MLYLVKNFIAESNSCVAKYGAECPICDIFSLECFSTANETLEPMGIDQCPISCWEEKHTSCDNATQCSNCVGSLCVSCYKDLCTQCIPYAKLSSRSQCSCIQGYAFNLTSQQCEPCHPSCETCYFPGDKNSCTSCQLYYLLFKNGSEISCVSSCPHGYKNENNICQKICHRSCKTCGKPLIENDCLSCFPGFLLLKQENSSFCVQKCPNNYIAEGSLCLPCHPSCDTCLKPYDNNSCQGCANSSYYINE